MKVQGNRHDYTHSALDWLNGPFVSSGEWTLSWTVDYSFGETEIVHFLLVPTSSVVTSAVISTSVPLLDALAGALGEVDLRSVLARDAYVAADLERFSLKSATSTSIGLLLSFGATSLVLPRDVIGSVQLKMVGKERSLHGYRLALDYAKADIRKVNMSPSDMARAAPYVAAIAFHCGTVVETAADGYLAASASASLWDKITGHTVFSRFHAMRSFALTERHPGYVTPLLVFASLLAAGCAGFGLSRFFRRRQRLHALSPSALLALFSLLSVFAWVIGYRRAAGKRQALVAPETLPAGPSSPVMRADVCMKTRPLTALHPTASVILPDYEECVPKFGNQLHGFAIAHVAPVVARSCQHNLTVAIVNRGCMDTTYDPLAFYDFTTWVTANASILLPHDPVLKHDFDEWLKRFPSGRAAMLRLARDAVRDGTYPGALDGNSSAFVKRENALKSFDDGIAAFDPRLIQAQTDAHQVVTGRWTWQASKSLARVWGPHLGGEPLSRPFTSALKTADWPIITYASGLNVNEIGCWFSYVEIENPPIAIIVGGDDVFARFTFRGEPLYLWMDAIRHDAHFHVAAHELRMALHQRAGLRNAKALSALRRQSYVSGATRCGHRFFVGQTLQSGTSDTSLANSKQVGLQTYYAIQKVYKSTIFTVDNLFEAINSILTSLGFPQEGGVSRTCDGDFFSSYFVPVDRGFVLTPKPGRMMSKVCFSERPYSVSTGLSWVRGVAVGLYPSVTHMPVLRSFFANLILLTEGHSTKPYSLPEVYRNVTAQRPSHETYVWFLNKYGCTMSDIEEVERGFSSAPGLPYVFDHPLLRRMIEIDCDVSLEPDDRSSAPYFDLVSAIRAVRWSWGLNQAEVRKPYKPFLRPDLSLPGWVGWVAFVVYATISAPLLEEAAKRVPYLGPVATSVISLFESLSLLDPSCLSIPRFLLGTVGRFVTHFSLRSLPYKYGVLAHSLINAIILVGGLQFLWHLHPITRFFSLLFGGGPYALSWERFYRYCRDPTVPVTGDKYLVYTRNYVRTVILSKWNWYGIDEHVRMSLPSGVRVRRMRYKTRRFTGTVVASPDGQWSYYPCDVPEALVLAEGDYPELFAP